MASLELVSGFGDALYLRGDWEAGGQVQLRSVGADEPLAKVATVLDFGGRRLALCGSTEEPIIIAGAWERHGVCGYSADGTLLWQRRDLKRPQVLTPAGGGALVAVHCESRPLHILAAATGETVTTLRGIYAYIEDPHGAFAIGGSFGKAVGIDPETWSVRWRNKLGFGASPEWHEAALSPTAALLAGWDVPPPRAGVESPMTMPGALFCLQPDGLQLWRADVPADWGAVPLMWDPTPGEWVVLERSQQDARSCRLVRYSREGDRVTEQDLKGDFWHGTFVAPNVYVSPSGMTLTL